MSDGLNNGLKYTLYLAMCNAISFAGRRAAVYGRWGALGPALGRWGALGQSARSGML